MKIIKNIALYLTLSFSILSSLSAQDKTVNHSGSWLGKLSLGAVELRLVFNLSLNEDGEYIATMDSPDQGAKGIPVGPVRVTSDSIIISAASLRGEYNGKLIDDSSLEGNWTQAGREMPLNLKKQTEEFKLNRPQEPKEPYPYKSKDVTFQNSEAGISLGGTLTIPMEGQNHPGVILVSGSGSQNRDEEIFGHKPFKVLADYLSRNGIAVLRYDDRGVGESGGTPIGATSADFATDANAAVKYLKSVDRVDKSKVGVIGHSEGGLIAQLIASGNEDIAFIVSMAGPGTTGRQILLDQVEHINRLSGVLDADNENYLKVNRAIYDVVSEIEDPSEGLQTVREKTSEILKEQGWSEEDIESFATNVGNDLGPASYPWMRYFILSDPANLLKSVKCPLLAINGEKDCQVLYSQNLDGIGKGLKKAGNDDVTLKSFPELNHLFQHSTTGLVNEYGVIEETISPEVLEVISNWINERFK